jgi:hypothetical protein
MTPQTLTPLTQNPETPARRQPSLLERSHLAAVVLSICVGLFYIGRALMAA